MPSHRAPHGGRMTGELNRVIEQVSKEKGIDKAIVISAIEEMMHSAARRTFGERKQIFNEFKDRKSEVVSGIVQRFERKNMIVNLGRTEAILPEKEQIPHERYRQGDRIRALILDVDLSEKGLSIVLSRTANEFLCKLFEQEVPEIYEGIVEIRQCAREPGGRAKVAVYSKDSDV